jgi:hypothetical protein
MDPRPPSLGQLVRIALVITLGLTFAAACAPRKSEWGSLTQGLGVILQEDSQ